MRLNHAVLSPRGCLVRPQLKAKYTDQVDRRDVRLVRHMGLLAEGSPDEPELLSTY